MSYAGTQLNGLILPMQHNDRPPPLDSQPGSLARPKSASVVTGGDSNDPTDPYRSILVVAVDF